MDLETRDVLDNLDITLEKTLCMSQELLNGYFDMRDPQTFALYYFSKYSTIAHILCDYANKACEMLTELLKKEDAKDADA